MSVQEFKGVMPEPSKVFRKASKGSEVYAYHHNALQMFLNVNRQVEFIEISRSEHLSAVCLGLDLLQTPADEVIECLLRLSDYDRSDPEQGYSFVFKSLELALWRPLIPMDKYSEDGQYFSTVCIGRSGYLSGE